MKKLFVLILGLAFVLNLCLTSKASAQGPLTGPTKGKLAVTPEGYDNMKSVLTEMGYEADSILYQELSDLNKLKQYTAVYINCSGGVDSVSDEAAGAIKQYVQEGGVVYASDYADTLIANAFPGKISFYKGDTMGARVGSAGKQTAKVVDSGMAAVLGKNQIEVNYDLPSWAVMQGTSGTVHISGPAPVMDYSALMQNAQNFDFSKLDMSNMAEYQKQLEKMQTTSSKTLPDVPYVVSFSEGKGEVLYTSFHNEAQVTADVSKVLNWFAIRTQASDLVEQSRGLASGQEKSLVEIVDSIKKNETKKYQFSATGSSPFKVVLNFGGSSIEITVKDPSGKIVATQTIDKPPYTVDVNTPSKGKYTVEVRAVDVPSNNYPFVVSVLGAQNAVEKTATFTGQQKAYTAVKTTQDWLKYGMWIGIGALAVVILIVVLVILRKRNK